MTRIGSSSRSMAGLRSTRTPSWIGNARSRASKEAVVTDIKSNLEDSNLVFGMRFDGFSVKQIEELRKTLPEDTKMKVAMNTLMKRAAEENGEFSAITPACQGINAWWFVGENVATGVKSYLKFEEDCKKAAKADPTSPVPSLSGGVMDGDFLDEAAIKNLKNLPTRAEVMANIAGCVKAVPTKLARSIKQVPQKMAVGVSKLADGDDNKDLIVGDIFPKAEEA
jgi:large subunit ribosomal protein L10